MFIHPLFQGAADEEARLDLFAKALGFECDVRVLDPIDMDSKSYAVYQNDGEEFIDAWKPETTHHLPEGHTLAGKYDSESGPVAFYVKPTSEFSEQLLNLSATELRRQLQEQAA